MISQSRKLLGSWKRWNGNGASYEMKISKNGCGRVQFVVEGQEVKYMEKRMALKNPFKETQKYLEETRMTEQGWMDVKFGGNTISIKGEGGGK